jgi:hypothetical protein
MQEETLVLDFSKIDIPVPYESKNTSDMTYVRFGLDNAYPHFLLSLYQDSAIHSSIINSKVNYLIGKGLGIDNEVYNPLVNPTDTLNELTSKCVKDYLIHNYFGVEVQFNKLGQVMYYNHIPAHMVRFNKSKTLVYVNEDWKRQSKTITYSRFHPSLNDTSLNNKIFIFDGYYPSVSNVYPNPSYIGAVRSIMTSVQIDQFNLNNISNGFSPNTLITFFNGENVSAKRKEEIVESIKQKFSGSQGGKFIVDFQHSTAKETKVEQLSSNDWSEAYIELCKHNTDQIMTAHSIVNPSLFGIKTAGQLGGSQELEVSYNLLKNSFIDVERNVLMSAFKMLFQSSSIIVNPSKLEFLDKPLFQSDLDNSTKEKILTINELRKLAGYEPISNGDRLISEPTVQPTELGVEKKKSYSLTYDDYKKIEHLGTSIDQFEIVEEEYDRFSTCEHDGCVTITEKFDKESDIANYIIGNDVKNMTLNDIQNELSKQKIDVTQNQIQKAIDKMVEGNLITVTSNDNRLTIRPNPMPEIPNTRGEIFTMYQYVKKPNVKGSPVINTTRDFCRSVIESNKLYTREDIQTMSSVFGYNIFRYAGGWYFNPDTGETTKSCRHKWIPISVRRRN